MTSPLISFHSLEEVGDLLVGVFVVGITHIGTLSKQGIRFIEKEDPVFVFGFIKKG